MMKRLLLLLLCVLLIPSVPAAQEEDERYGAGAVSEEDGKVVFSGDVTDVSLSQGQLYDRLLAWAKSRFDDENNRVVYENRDKYEFVARGMEKLIFSSTALSLDTSEMSFHLIVRVTGNTAKIRLTNISYKYNDGNDRKPQRFSAEDIITDKYALTKKNKLNRINGKFRRATIDFTDNIFGEMPAPAAAAPVPAAEKDGYIVFETSKVPQSILAMLSESPMQVSTNMASALVETGASWKGISEMFGKSVAIISISGSCQVYRQINDKYILSFMKEGEGMPWIIIECRKQGETSDGENKTLLGEIVQIRIK